MDLVELTGGTKVETHPPYAQRLGQLACATGESAGRIYGRARLRTRIYYAGAAAKTRRLLARARDRARYLKSERPMHVLGTIAVGAFVCGIALRIWRSEN